MVAPRAIGSRPSRGGTPRGPATRRPLGAVVWTLACASAASSAFAAEAAGAGPASGRVAFEARRRVESGPGRIQFRYEALEWAPAETAVIVCDMWDRHWCRGAERRVAELAPRANEFVAKARELGMLIVHAPSDTMRSYAEHPARRRALAAPRAPDLPEEIARACFEIPAERGSEWPIDQSDGGCDCDPPCPQGRPWTRQTPAIEIRDEDAISDSGAEIWNLFAARGIRNVVLLGVHANMCVLARPFALRNLVRFGKNAVLVRDLTDSMYNSRRRPEVSHFTGTDLVVAHIERYVCPTVLSTALTGREAFRFRDDSRPRVVFVSAENEYGAAETLPEFARFLELRGGLATEVLQGSTAPSGAERHRVPGLRALETADLVVLFARRRALPAEDMKRLRDYLGRGKPLVALRTSSHAFSPREPLPEGWEAWETFDREVLGCRYDGHYGGGTVVSVAAGASGHPILEGIAGPYRIEESLYRSLDLVAGAKPLLEGRRADGADAHPVAWTNEFRGARVFYTSLGSAKAAFPEPWFRRLLANAVFWALDRPVPERATRGFE